MNESDIEEYGVLARKSGIRTAAFFLLGALFAMCVGVPARAQTRDDQGLWFMLMADGRLGRETSRFRWWLDVQPRFLDDVDGLQQGLFRPGVGYALGERTTAWLGYARVRTDIGGGDHSNEDRIWQQLLWKPRLGEVALQSRTRLEQRFLDTASDTGWRFRQFVKAGWQLPSSDRFSLEAYEEAFFNLNDTRWGQDTGFAQNRLFAGVGMKLGDQNRTKVEVGYLNQFIERGSVDSLNHILSINLFLKF